MVSVQLPQTRRRLRLLTVRPARVICCLALVGGKTGVLYPIPLPKTSRDFGKLKFCGGGRDGARGGLAARLRQGRGHGLRTVRADRAEHHRAVTCGFPMDRGMAV